MPSMSNSLVTGILEFSHLKSGVASVVLSVPMVLMASCELVPAMFDPETKQVIYNPGQTRTQKKDLVVTIAQDVKTSFCRQFPSYFDYLAFSNSCNEQNNFSSFP